MNVMKCLHRKSIVIVLPLLFFVANTVGQKPTKLNTFKNKCRTVDDIWDFAKPYKKKHAVLTIMGLKVNDTLSIKINGRLVLENHVYNNKDSLRIADINGTMDECYFLLYYSNNQLKTIYNSRNCSEYCNFERNKTKNAWCEVEITFNGKCYYFFFHLTARWHIVLIGRDSRKVGYYCEKYFRGIV